MTDGLSEEDIEALFLKVYAGFIEALDGIDNGAFSLLSSRHHTIQE